MDLINLQRIEKAETRADGALRVKEVFGTIQGEGPFAGQPAVFVRLAGCNLQCPGCDTEYTSDDPHLSLAEVVDRVEAVIGSQPGTSLVVITGGEPFRQNFGPLVRELAKQDLDVQVETNGTLFQEDVPLLAVTVICSPKTPRIHPEIAKHVLAYKYVLTAGEVSPEDGLPTSALGMPGHPARPSHADKLVYVQPADERDAEKNKRNLEACIASSKRFGYFLCLQLHKIAGLP